MIPQAIRAATRLASGARTLPATGVSPQPLTASVCECIAIGSRRALAVMNDSPQTSAKILLVDDDELSRDVIASLLKRALPLVEVRCAQDGDAGLVLYREIEPDLLITDLRMPGLSGAELIEVIRSTGTAMPILVVTGAPEARAVPGATEVILKTEFRHLIERAKSLLQAADVGPA